MRGIQRIPRLAVRAIASGAVMVAAALPLAAAGTAGAATTPATLSSAYVLSTGTGFTPTPASVTYSFATYVANATTVSVTATGYTYWPVGTTFVAGGSQVLTVATNAVTFASGSLTQTVTVTGTTSPENAGTVGTVTLPSTEALVYSVSSGALQAAINNGTSYTLPSGASISGTGIPANDYLTSSMVVTAVPAAMPLAIPLATGTSSVSSVTYATGTQNALPTFGAGGASGTIYVVGSGFAANGSTVTFTTSAAGVTFTNATELSSTLASATLTTSATTLPGFFSITVADGNGTSAPLANAFQVASAPTVTSVSPATLLTGTTAQSLTLTGSGLATGDSVAFTSAVDGTSLNVTGTITASSTTTATVNVIPENNVSGSATAGAYSITVTGVNSAGVFGGISTTNNVLTVNSFGFTSASPSYLPINTSAATSYAVTLTGTNLGTSGALQADYGTNTYGAGGNTSATAWLSNVTITNTSVTATVTVPTSVSAATFLNFYLINSSGAATTFDGAIGIGKSSTAAGNAPTITSVAPTGSVLTLGSAATLTVTGTNLVPGATSAAFNVGGTTTTDSGLTCSTFTAYSTTTGTCVITSVTYTAVAGPQDLVVTTAAGSATFANALSVAGPVITSASPSVLGIGVGQVVTLTGTGFPTANTTFPITISGGTVSSASGGTANAATAVSATSATVYVTANTSLVTLTIPGSNGVYTTSPTFSFTAGTAPTLGAPTYATNTNGVGAGATSVPVTWTGTGFLPGATLSFGSTGISATVTALTSTSITANVTVGAVTAGTYSVTVTNTNGGSVTTANDIAVTNAPGGINSTVGSGTTFSALSGATTTLTFSGGYYQTGLKVTAGNSLATIGTVALGTTAATGVGTPLSSFTTLSVPVTVPAISGTSGIATTITVTNADGGSTTYTLNISMQPTVSGTYYVPTFASNQQVIVSGTGFEAGMTVKSSNPDYTVLLGQVNPAVAPSLVSTAVLVVTTTANATQGTSSSVTFTNPDGGTVTFALNGGVAPSSSKAGLKAFRVIGGVIQGKTVMIKIVGQGFYAQPMISSNAAGTKAVVSGDTGRILTVRVSTKMTTPNGVHVFTITLANGKSTTVRYNQHK